MPTYTVFAGFGESGRMTCVYSFTAADDVAAEEFVIDRLTEKPVELWCRSRRIACIQVKEPC
jgi:hypothetical protein